MNTEIVIVDDDDGHAELIRANLKDAGIANPIVRYSNGYDFLDAILEPAQGALNPLLVLLDLNMPGMHGKEVLERLRADARTKLLPIVVLTTSGNSPEIRECYELGCNLFLVKPVQYDEFTRVIRTLGLVFQIVKLPDSK